jgi:putative sigma-54 modulation protein
MKAIIRGNNVEVTDSIKNYIDEKLSKMDKYFKDPNNTEAKVVISVNGIDQKVEVTINESKYFIRAEEIHSDLYSAVDIVIDKLERQFRKYKTKFSNKVKDVEVVPEIEDYFDEPEEEVVKRKELFLKPMDEEEAITQMELLGHTFFVFKNIEDKKICVVYKRKDGAYGILETN